ncbi:hypothetical protein Tco_1490119, partial [Tanacetum coccineum]
MPFIREGRYRNGGIGGSKFRVGEGKVQSIGGIGGGAFSIHSIVSKDGRGGGGLVVDGGRSSKESRKSLRRSWWSGEQEFYGIKGGDEVSGLLKQHGLTLIPAVLFKLVLLSLGIVRENDENEVTNHFLL